MFNDKINMIFKAFHVHGHEVRLVGGCARDFIMGITPNDWDFATTATPDEIAHVAQRSGWTCIPTGIDHGTMTVVVDSEPFEITTLRVDSNQDGRHAEVEFTTDWEKDVMRRDFTINGIYINSAGEIIDLVGGVEDIKNKKLRFIGNGIERMEEDALRVIRGFRFATRFGMHYPEEFSEDFIEKSEYATVKSGIKNLSVERIWSELKKIYSIHDYDKLNDFGSHFVFTGMAELTGFIPCWNLHGVSRNPICKIAYVTKGNFNISSFKPSKEELKDYNAAVFVIKSDYKDIVAAISFGKIQHQIVSEIGAVHVCFYKFNPATVVPFEFKAETILRTFDVQPGIIVGEMYNAAKQIWAENDFYVNDEKIVEELKKRFVYIPLK